MRSKIVLLNGGKGCGKTAAVKRLKEVHTEIISAECKENLFDLTIKLFNLTPSEFYNIYENRAIKEIPSEAFKVHWTDGSKLNRILRDASLSERIISSNTIDGHMLLSVREAIIFVSEVIVKPSFGEDYFGKARANKIRSRSESKEEISTRLINETELYIDDSAGFHKELPPLIDLLGQENILLIRIKGRGSFEGDSRMFIPDSVITNTVDIDNSLSEEEFLKQIEVVVGRFLNV